jgi:DNA-binding NarL/FixJ family response regulator
MRLQKMSVELILSDPHPVMLDGLDSVFHRDSGLSVCCRVQDGESAWQAVRQLKPRILIHELDLPKKDGLDLIRAIRADSLPTLSIVFTSAAREHIVDALKLGVPGLIGKDKPGDALLACVLHWDTPLSSS